FLSAHDQEAGDPAGQRGDRGGGEEPAQRFAEAVLREKPRRVRAEAEKRRMTERDDPRVAQDQVERQCEQSCDQDLAAEREIAREEKKRRDRDQPKRDLELVPLERRQCAHARRPTRPAGKSSSMITITA